ncbi:MAG TPA: histidine phosphatase family protein [Candidatus Omnitrophota bacterium]|nr:histidine phosphatase family protein [Candidatus Omnitrophota bacterium]HPS37555.1 histidine phosphatase family protein [Candidatus Omnitrophota bacterium]
MTRIILVRHGETAWTLEGRYQGRTDTLLTSKGKTQASKLARFFKNEKIDCFYSSRRSRAYETARAIAKFHGKEVRQKGYLDEMSFGAWEGKTFRDLIRERDPIYRAWCRGRLLTPRGGESISHFTKRIRAALEEFRKKHPGKTVLAVTHGGVIRMALTLALGLSLKKFWAFAVSTASFTVLEFEGGYLNVKCVNHLP